MKLKQLILRFWLATLITLTVFSCSTTDASRYGQQRIVTSDVNIPPSAESDTNKIAIGDSVLISVWDAPQFNTSAFVRRGGVISIPLVGEIRVAGFTKEELLRLLRRKLSEYIKGEALLFVEIKKPLPKITVIGQVARQGNIPVDKELPLLEVLIAAGVWTDNADLRYIRITHQSTSARDMAVVEFDLTPFLETGEMGGMPIVHPGDVVIVPKKEDYVQELGGLVTGLFVLLGIFNVFN